LFLNYVIVNSIKIQNSTLTNVIKTSSFTPAQLVHLNKYIPALGLEKVVLALGGSVMTPVGPLTIVNYQLFLM
jgi:hypothetical protein